MVEMGKLGPSADSADHNCGGLMGSQVNSSDLVHEK